MDRSVRGADSVALVLRSFAVRGIVEGFYGTPWTHDSRLEVISFLAERGMNAYAYAPKDDARHRAEWRDPYGADELARFGEVAAHGAVLGVQFGFAISPGLDIDYDRIGHQKLDAAVETVGSAHMRPGGGVAKTSE